MLLICSLFSQFHLCSSGCCYCSELKCCNRWWLIRENVCAFMTCYHGYQIVGSYRLLLERACKRFQILISFYFIFFVLTVLCKADCFLIDWHFVTHLNIMCVWKSFILKLGAEGLINAYNCRERQDVMTIKLREVVHTFLQPLVEDISIAAHIQGMTLVWGMKHSVWGRTSNPGYVFTCSHRISCRLRLIQMSDCIFSRMENVWEKVQIEKPSWSLMKLMV